MRSKSLRLELQLTFARTSVHSNTVATKLYCSLTSVHSVQPLGPTWQLMKCNHVPHQAPYFLLFIFTFILVFNMSSNLLDTAITGLKIVYINIHLYSCIYILNLLKDGGKSMYHLFLPHSVSLWFCVTLTTLSTYFIIHQQAIKCL